MKAGDTMQTIVLASDHGGFTLKTFLKAKLAAAGYAVEDLGPDCAESCDYPPFAQKAARRVLEGGCLGILICGTGLGMAIAANRFHGVRAALCTNEFMARMAREHNDANILCLGERVVGQGLAWSMVQAFLDTNFAGERHQRRLDLIEHV